MDLRFYNNNQLDIQRLAYDLGGVYYYQGYQVYRMGDQNQMIVRLTKGSEMFGLQGAVTVTIQRQPNGVTVFAGQQKWADKIVFGIVGFFVPLLIPFLITAIIGLVRQAGLSNVLTSVDSLVYQQMPPPMQQQGYQGNQGMPFPMQQQGYQGYQGNQGMPPPTQQQGNQGYQGYQGNQGNQSNQGNQGP